MAAKMNLGCGFDIKQGWTNIDQDQRVMSRYEYGKDIEGWNVVFPPPDFYWNRYDFVLINHVLCTMKPSDVNKVLENARMCLKDGGRLQVIDMDLLKAFDDYESGNSSLFPIADGDIDYKLCMHVSGYGTRLSLYTVKHLHDLLIGAGFKSAKMLLESEYDTRPDESLILEATK